MGDTRFAEHYDNFYDRDEHTSAWRAAGALEKFENIRQVWARSAEGTPSVVDIGCGDGAIASCMDDAGFYSRLSGFDVSTTGVEKAKGRSLRNAEFARATGPLPVPDGAFELAVLSHVVEHVEDPRSLLREAARAARWVIVEVPLEHTLRSRGDFHWTDTGHVNFYDLALIRKLIQSCDLEVKAEIVTTPGHAWAKARGDVKELAKWRAKNTALALWPAMAQSLFCYHATLLARAGR